jgi:hypothetical protein
LLADAASLRSGRAPSGCDRWGHHMRGLRVHAHAHAHAHAQALGWAWGDTSLAEPLLDAAASLADSGLAGVQAPACLALAETLRPCREGDPPPPYPRIDGTLDQARQAVHNVQDPTVCARTTARVHVMGRHGWPTFDLDARARRLPEARHGLAYNALHRVGIGGEGRRPGGLPSPAPQCDGRSLAALQALYQQPWDDFVRLNAPDRPRQPCDEVACPTRACCR